MSLALFKPELDIWEPGAHSGTFRGNNMAFVTAAQAIETYWSDNKLADDVLNKEQYVRNWLENVCHSFKDLGLAVRGRGLIQGLVMPVGDDLANKITHKAFDYGLVIETSGAHDEVIKILPPLTITMEQLEQGMEILERSINEILAAQGRRPQVLKVAGSR